jgi:type I restriction enzyme R subunit
MNKRHSEAAFETVIEAHLLANGYVTLNRAGFDRERAIFPETVLAFIRTTQPKAWAREEKRDDQGRKVKKETMIFPRYHQLQAVRTLVEAAQCEGVGHNYLIEHSAGSGKSNTIGWLAHRLASLHSAENQRVFDSVIVVTDRVVLDQQLQDTIYQFEYKRGVVQKIDESSRQLAEALENAVPVIITTLQKFPFVSRQLLKMAEERGSNGTGTLPTRRCAVIIDEAHSSQGGETATDLKEVLGGEELRAEAQQRAVEEGLQNMEELFRSMAKRGRQLHDTTW